MTTIPQDVETVVHDHLVTVLDSIPPAALGNDMADLLIVAIPELGRAADEDLRAGAAASCAANLTAVWELLRAADGDGDGDDKIVPPPEALAWSRELVHRGVELAALLRTYRLGQEFAEARIVQAAAALEIPDAIRWRLLARVSHHVFAYVDAVCTQLVDDYELEHSRWVRGAAAARAELVAAILERAPVDPRAATERLQYDVSRRHLGLIVWGKDSATRPPGSLEEATVKLATSLGGGPVLTIPIGENVVWAWTSGEHLTDDAASVPLPPGEGIRAAVGTCADGLSGMADSHDDARVARRAGELFDIGAHGPIAYRAAGLLSLLTTHPAEAVRFAETELGELVDDTDAGARLRATLLVYLEENLSPARTARRLGIHHNTVIYRVKQAAETLGRPIEARRLELEVALRIAARLDALRAARDRSRRAQLRERS